jgi:hypothetical protein
MSMEFLVKFFGLLLGILARTLLPWLRKVKEGKIRSFNRRYIYSALVSAAIGFFLTLTVFPRFEAAAGQGFEELFKLFCLAFGFGYGSNALVNEGGAWAAKSGGIEPLGGDEGQTPAR